jgi:hypothetical protein
MSLFLIQNKEGEVLLTTRDKQMVKLADVYNKEASSSVWVKPDPYAHSEVGGFINLRNNGVLNPESDLIEKSDTALPWALLSQAKWVGKGKMPNWLEKYGAEDTNKIIEESSDSTDEVVISEVSSENLITHQDLAAVEINAEAEETTVD